MNELRDVGSIAFYFFKEPDSLLQRLQFPEHGRDQFRDSRMIRTKTLRLDKVSLTYTLRS